MYGEGRSWRYIIGFGLLFVLLIVVIVLIMRGGNGSSKVPEAQRTLTSYVNDPDVTIRETIIGPITAAQNHNEIQIDVTNATANIQIMQGYDGNVIGSRDYGMTPSAFSEFLRSLDKSGFTKGNTASDLKNDSGYCPTGERYIFEVKTGSTNVERFWTTSCSGTPKTYKGNMALTIDLFQSQIPDYDKLTSDINFSSGSFGL